MLKIKPSVRLYLSKELEFFLPYIDRFSKRVNSMRNLHSLFVISLGNRVPGTNNKGYFIAFLVRSLKTRKAFAGPEGRPALLFYLTRPRFLSSMYDSLQWVLVVAAIRRSFPLLLLLVSRQREHLELRESSSKK